MKPTGEITRIPVDAGLWRRDDFAARLKNCFRDVVEPAPSGTSSPVRPARTPPQPFTAGAGAG